MRILQNFEQLTWSRLWNEYDDECLRVGLQPVARRTFTTYLNRLAALGLAELRRGRNGNTRLVRYVPVPQHDTGQEDEGTEQQQDGTT